MIDLLSVPDNYHLPVMTLLHVVMCAELLFTLDHEGVVTVFNTRAKNPSTKMATWTSTEDVGTICELCVGIKFQST